MKVNEIRRLASKNTKENKAKLIKEINRTAKRANRRLTNLYNYQKRTGKSLEKSAYGRAKSSLKRLGISKFGDTKGMGTKRLARQLQILKKFESSDTSTIKGIKDYEKRMQKALNQSNMLNINIKNKEREKFFSFISTQFVQELKQFDSGRVFGDVLDAIREGKTVEELESAWNDYKLGEMTIDEAWEEWTGVNPFL